LHKNLCKSEIMKSQPKISYLPIQIDFDQNYNQSYITNESLFNNNLVIPLRFIDDRTI